MKCPVCFKELDIASTMCSKCWEEYATFIDEETHQMNEMACAEESAEVFPKKFIGSGEDVCLNS